MPRTRHRSRTVAAPHASAPITADDRERAIGRLSALAHRRQPIEIVGTIGPLVVADAPEKLKVATAAEKDKPMIPETLIKAKLDLTTVDGNAHAIVGAVRHALKAAGNTLDDIAAVVAEMMGGDYDHLLFIAQEVTEPPGPVDA